jgi:hypothetical protein
VADVRRLDPDIGIARTDRRVRLPVEAPLNRSGPWFPAVLEQPEPPMDASAINYRPSEEMVEEHFQGMERSFELHDCSETEAEERSGAVCLAAIETMHPTGRSGLVKLAAASVMSISKAARAFTGAASALAYHADSSSL